MKTLIPGSKDSTAQNAVVSDERGVVGLETRVSAESSFLPSAIRPPALIVVVLALAVLVWGIQTGAGAAKAGFGAYPDEPSHFLSAVMIHDYIVSPLHKAPMAHAMAYYVYRPFFAVGYWPPVFYLMEALWMVVFGVGRSQAVAFVFLEAVLLATSAALVARRWVDTWTGLAIGALLMLLPVMQWSSSVVMTDLTVAMFAFWATLSLGKYFDRDSWRSAMAFGVFAGLALLSKYLAGFLAFLPVVALLSMRRFDLLRKGTFWLQPLVVALMIGPWFWPTRHLMSLGFSEYKPEPFEVRVRMLSASMWHGLSGPLCVVLALAWVYSMVNWRRLTNGDRVLLLQPLVVTAFLLFDPTGLELRHFLPAFPCLVLALPMSLSLLRSRFRADTFRVAAPFAAAVLVVLYGFWSWQRFKPLPGQETRAAVAWLSGNNDLRDSAILLPTDWEGPMISEFAISESSPAHHILVRPTKYLANEDWLGIRYRPIYSSAAELSAALRQSPLRAVVVAPDCKPVWPHDQMLNQVLNDPESGWSAAGTFPAPNGCILKLYQRAPSSDNDMKIAYAYFEAKLGSEIHRLDTKTPSTTP